MRIVLIRNQIRLLFLFENIMTPNDSTCKNKNNTFRFSKNYYLLNNNVIGWNNKFDYRIGFGLGSAIM